MSRCVSMLTKDSWHPLDIACIAKVYDSSHPKTLLSKQILQRLPIAHAQVTADNTAENLLNEIWQIMNSLYWAKEIMKKVYNNIMT